MADPTSVTQQIVSESPAVEAYILNLLKNASNLAYDVNPDGTPAAQTLAQRLPGYQIRVLPPVRRQPLTPQVTQELVNLLRM